MLALFVALFLYGCVLTPFLTIYAWIRWAGSRRRKAPCTRWSFAALALSSISLVTAMTALAISCRHGGFLLLTPGMQRLFFPGLALAAVAVLFSLVGLRHSNPLRLKTPILAIGTIVFWLLANSGD